MDETWTILKVLQWTTDYFRKKGLDQPRADAEVLLAHALGIRRMDLYLRFDQPLQAEELARYRAFIRRRAAREPTQYITGRQEFWSLELKVSPAVLIPRPETERLVELALERCGPDPIRVLDLGTGSGAVAVALATERPRWTFIASDIAWNALEVARQNAVRHGVHEQIHFVCADGTTPFPTDPGPFHLICANPPYVGDREWETLAPEITCFEPASALRGGNADGTRMPLEWMKAAFRALQPGGYLLMEFGKGQEKILEAEARNLPGVRVVRVHRDYAHIPRVLEVGKS